MIKLFCSKTVRFFFLHTFIKPWEGPKQSEDDLATDSFAEYKRFII